jgi:hypothetical protein
MWRDQVIGNVNINLNTGFKNFKANKEVTAGIYFKVFYSHVLNKH